jgi:flagellar biogenesis protein FliO
LKKNHKNLRITSKPVSTFKVESCVIKKIFPFLFLISASIAYPASKQQDTEPSSSSTEQLAPSESSNSSQEPSSASHSLQPTPEVNPVPQSSSKEMTDSYENAFVRMLVTLLGLVFLVFVTFWILRRLGKGKFKMGAGRTINIIDRRSLSPKSMLYVIEIGNKKVLISESQLEVRALTAFDDLPESE